MELEIKVMWCKGLTAFNFFQKLTVYAAVSITTKNDSLKLTKDQKQEQITPVDDDGGGNPEWNYAMKFVLRPLKSICRLEDLSLLFELRNQGQLFGYKTIGEVCVPLTELIHSVGGEVVRFVKYEVRSPDGKHNGILDFSYKFIGNINDTVSPDHSNHHITGYHHHHHRLDDNIVPGTDSDTHVTGYHHHQHSQLDGNVAQSTHSDTHVMGYHHHHSQSDGNTPNSDTHVMGYHHHHSQSDGNTTQITHSDTHVIGYHHHRHHSQLVESASISESVKIQYPKIDLEGNLAPPLVCPAPVVPTLYPQMWGPPVQLSHYPPPQPYAYPPPPLPQQLQQPYGDPHWGYNRPLDYHHW